MKTCLFRRDGYSLQGYQGAFRHERSISIVKPQSPRSASPSGGACSQSAAFEKPQLPSERTPMLSQCQCSRSAAGNERLKNTVVCQGEGQQWSLFSFCLGFCFVCVSVVSTFFFFLLTFDVAWLVVGGHSLRHLEPANGRSVIQLGSLSSRVMPPWRGWHALLEHMLPGWSDDARNT